MVTMSLRDYVEGLLDPSAPLNVPRRFKHDEPSCSSRKDACLVVTRRVGGWEFWCHRCGKGGVIGLGDLSTGGIRSFAQGRRERAPEPTGVVRSVKLPRDYTPEIPPAGLVWLYGVGITPDEIAKCNIGYSPGLSRVILPVYDRDGVLIYWQGRYLGDHKADKQRKYLNQWMAGRQSIYFRNERHQGDTEVVLVEDILSAIKVGRVTNAIALLFATVPLHLGKSLVEQGYTTIWIWLDADKSVYSANQVVRMRAFGYPARRVYSPRDPKHYAVDEIAKFLGR